jgi:Xaa-Pro aminopeptidase
MNNEITARLEALRSKMKSKGIAAFLVNGSDPHMSEYVAGRWKTREYLSGFTGSYGWLAITQTEAALWTDSRYYLQAEQQLEGTGITMLKARLPETIPTECWVSDRLNAGDIVCFDGACYSLAEVNGFLSQFRLKNISIDAKTDLLSELWDKRLEIPNGKIIEHPVCYSGTTRKQKFEAIRQEMEAKGCDIFIITALDDLAWTFNLRGCDVDYNPVFYGYGVVTMNEAVLFCNPIKFDKALIETIKAEQIQLAGYDDIFNYLSGISGKNVWIDSNRTNYLISECIAAKNKLFDHLSIPCKLKSIKNDAEIEGFRKAVIADGLALLDFQLWLNDTLGKQTITEYDVAVKLSEFRSKQSGYRGDSFHPIVGYKAHGAIVH